jgi:hypothetical protein
MLNTNWHSVLNVLISSYFVAFSNASVFQHLCCSVRSDQALVTQEADVYLVFLKEGDYLEDLGIDGKITLKWI